MNPRVSRSLRARVEGDRLSDRQGRGEARGRLHARRDPERPDGHDAGELRADARLRRRQVAALRVREVPRRRHDARHADEVGRRVDGHRPHVREAFSKAIVEPRAGSTGSRVTPWRRSSSDVPDGRCTPLVPAASSTARCARERARLWEARRTGASIPCAGEVAAELELLLLDARRGRRGAARAGHGRAS